jgi:hypothetical protein
MLASPLAAACFNVALDFHADKMTAIKGGHFIWRAYKNWALGTHRLNLTRAYVL